MAKVIQDNLSKGEQYRRDLIDIANDMLYYWNFSTILILFYPLWISKTAISFSPPVFFFRPV
jgi:hypothetical protein